MTNLEKWCIKNGISELYNQYSADVEAMQEELDNEGFPGSGSEFELRLEGIRGCYPELFDEELFNEAEKTVCNWIESNYDGVTGISLKFLGFIKYVKSGEYSPKYLADVKFNDGEQIWIVVDPIQTSLDLEPSDPDPDDF